VTARTGGGGVNMTDKLPAYVLDVLDMCKRGELADGLNIATIYHDHTCAYWVSGRCDCQADTVVTSEPGDKRLEIIHSREARK
jgi:hypothetical protein